MLKGKCVVIIGVVRGIGKVVVLKLVLFGVNIVLNYRSSEKEVKEVENFIKDMGVEVISVKGDIFKLDEVENFVLVVKEKFGCIDIMVNNVGIIKDILIFRMKEEDFDIVIDINLKGVFNCLKCIILIMVK